MRIRVRSAIVVVLTILTASVAASCSADPLSVTCGDYLKKAKSEQLDLAARWAAPDRNHVDNLATMVAPTYRDDLLRYCPAHSGDRLRDLELRIR